MKAFDSFNAFVNDTNRIHKPEEMPFELKKQMFYGIRVKKPKVIEKLSSRPEGKRFKSCLDPSI